MILYFDSADASERPVSAYNPPGSINSRLTIKTPCGAFSRLLDGLDVFIII